MVMTADQPGDSQEVYQFSRAYLVFRDVNGGLAWASGFVLNVLIITGIRRLHGNSLRNFRGLLVTLSVLDILYAFSSGITGMGFQYYNGGFFITVTGIVALGPPELSLYGYNFYVGTFGAFFLLQPVLFFCRYIIICVPTKVPMMTKPSVILGGFSCMFVLCAADVYLSSCAYTLTTNHPRFEVAETGEELFEQARFLITRPSSYHKVKLALMNTITLASLCFTVYCSVKIFAYLHKNESSFSESTRKGQRKLTVALILQPIFPVVTGILPLYLCMYIYMQQIGHFYFLWYSILLHVWQPAVSAVITIVFITPVRKAIRSFGCGAPKVFSSDF
uniref:G_PROTEIN_RECEP_F1_2 domain-containing protein n=1 Tax=Steinernema glaseri TaxID=37863 RepID=A0A1I7YJ95_9BILA